MKIVCMIPARLGSKRVPRKAIRMLGNKPLIQYAIDLATQVFDLDNVYVNASEDIFEYIASQSGVQFYR